MAPDGSKVLDGGEVIAVSGKVLAHIPDPFPQLPVWADDSAHLCVVSPLNVLSDAGSTGNLLEFDMSGRPRTVTHLGPVPAVSSAWQVLACSPASDRVIVAQETGQTLMVMVYRLSSGQLIARHSVADASLASAIAAHDGRIVAVNEKSGITIHNATTWAVLARIVRWGSQAGFPLIGAAVNISWDGSRIVVDGGGAGGGFHPEWMVHWATDRNVLTNTGPNSLLAGFDDAIPLTTGSAFLLPPGDGATDPGAAYLLDPAGSLQRIPG